MFRKLLVANRGEIAIRAFRAAYELGMPTVAVYAPEDRNSAHRLKADESYELGVPGHPVRAYLDVELVVELAPRIGADAIYPGYGFMSENPELARRCAAAGITFVGPPADVLAIAGNKVRAREAARRAGRPGASGHRGADRVAEVGGRLRRAAVPAVRQGGGGRAAAEACDWSRTPTSLEDAAAAAMREAEGAFGDASVYLEAGGHARPTHRGAGARRTRPARSCTCSSATARSSAATRR